MFTMIFQTLGGAASYIEDIQSSGATNIALAVTDEGYVVTYDMPGAE